MIPPLVIEGVTVSSTHLKALLEAGDVETAARFCGHPHSISGVVQPGRHLGHTLGFPTANLLPAPELVLPRDGVYAVKATLGEPGGQARLVPTGENEGADEKQCFIGVCNVGTRPTVGGHRRTVETWLDGFDGDLYGQKLTVDFYRRLRDEQKFDSLEALRDEIFRNQEEARAYFGTQK